MRARNRAEIRDAERWEPNTDKLVGVIDSTNRSSKGARHIDLGKLPGLIGKTVDIQLLVLEISGHNSCVVNGIRLCNVCPGKINVLVHAIPVKKTVGTGEIHKGNIVAHNHTGVVYGRGLGRV